MPAVEVDVFAWEILADSTNEMGLCEKARGDGSVTGGAAQETYDGVRIGPPPDLASLLLHNRIVYLGMPMVSAVTELIVAELLYLNYE